MRFCILRDKLHGLHVAARSQEAELRAYFLSRSQWFLGFLAVGPQRYWNPVVGFKKKVPSSSKLNEERASERVCALILPLHLFAYVRLSATLPFCVSTRLCVSIARPHLYPYASLHLRRSASLRVSTSPPSLPSLIHSPCTLTVHCCVALPTQRQQWAQNKCVLTAASITGVCWTSTKEGPGLHWFERAVISNHVVLFLKGCLVDTARSRRPVPWSKLDKSVSRLLTNFSSCMFLYGLSVHALP